jgi:phenylacetate-coenzyme A ligase PaaK-like adenylate-forming protein
MPQAAIFSNHSSEAFEQLALDTFAYQYEHVSVYRTFCDSLRINPSSVNSLTEIPFLPIQFFKTHPVLDDSKKATTVFNSSGTTGATRSKHFVADLSLYEQSFHLAFRHFFGAVEDLVILALLPSYFEQEQSSLIYMVNKLIESSKAPESGFYLKDTERLIQTIESLESQKKRTLLLGVSYALLDLTEKHRFQLKNTMVMETGGMKGRRGEMIREELHEVLKRGFGTTTLYSEYGMTELLSQAYSTGDGLFKCPPWMKVLTRDTEDPLSYLSGTTGGINVIDLANRYSCSFIATQDLGKLRTDGSFEILGRFDTSDIRGCNLMVL